ncbi:MAG: alkaline phosphatase family protein, partial [Phycisphaerae bacterium]
RYIPPSSTDGFRSLLRRGTFFRSARFEHGITFTAVGHATLFTGGHVPDHGIAGNEWFDASLRRSVAAVQDGRYPIVGQPPADGKGCSPANLTSTTIGDELVLASGGRSRMFSVSAKDRGAILPGGYLGKAFWYSTSTGQYVTSTYYYKKYPDWVARWNASRPADAFGERAWTLLDDPGSYRNADRDDRPCERGYKHLKRTFPHPLTAEKPADLYAAVAYTPFSDELTIAFAEEVLRCERLGQGEAVDLLAISLSATDQIGHAWGPESLEAEDNTRRVDALLGRFFRRLDETVGLANTLLILAADHGMDDIPECAEAIGIPAGRHYPARFLRAVNDGLKARFRIDVDLVTTFWNPSLYFDLGAVRRLGLDLPAVEQAAAEEVMKVPGMACAVTRTALLQGRLPAGTLGHAIELSFHPERSGNVLIFPKPFWYLYHDPDCYAATHGSPYAYDTFVPVLVAGPGIPVQIVNRTISPADLAPTVAAYLGVKPPSGCTGRTIEELLRRNE